MYKPIEVTLREFSGLEPALEAMRFPMEGRASKLTDEELAFNLMKAGDDHGKFARGIMVWFEIKMQVGFMIEWDTYRIGIDCLSTTSSMHSELRELTGKKLAAQKQYDLPTKYYKRMYVANYQALRRIYKQRRSHKHPDWEIFCDWLEQLPYSELITGRKNDNNI